jgi:hypothetical protein
VDVTGPAEPPVRGRVCVNACKSAVVQADSAANSPTHTHLFMA